MDYYNEEIREEEIKRAKKKAMSLLEQMDRTEWQLRDKLASKEFSEESIEEAIAYVYSFHYLDDLRYAMHFVEIHRADRSIQRMKQDLRQRHVPEDDIETALDAIDRDDSEALERDLRKVWKNRDSLTYEEKQKLIGKLYRKGYRLEQIKDAINAMQNNEID